MRHDIIGLMTDKINHSGIKPDRFLGDLIRDGHTISKRYGNTHHSKWKEFYWIIRECGTNIAFDRDSAKQVWEIFEDCKVCYHYNLEDLVTVDTSNWCVRGYNKNTGKK